MFAASELLPWRWWDDLVLFQVLVRSAPVQPAIWRISQVPWLLGYSFIIFIFCIVVINRRQVIPVTINLGIAILIIYLWQVDIDIAIVDVRHGL